MAKKLHHATKKRAEENGITINWSAEEDTWLAEDAENKHGILAQGNDPKALLDEAMDALYKAETGEDPEEPTEEESEDEEEHEGGSIVPEKYKSQYKEYGGTNGDVIADHVQDTTRKYEEGPKGGQVSRVDLEAVTKIAQDNDVDMTAWTNLNPGQQRMNLGNVLRSRLLRGEKIKIGSTKLNLMPVIKQAKNDAENGEIGEDEATKILEQFGLKTNKRTIRAVVRLAEHPDA